MAHISSSRMYEINGEVEGFAISGMMIDRRIKQSRARLYNYQEKPLKHQKRSPKADRVVTSLETQWELVLKAMVKVAVKVTKDKLVTCNCREFPLTGCRFGSDPQQVAEISFSVSSSRRARYVKHPAGSNPERAKGFRNYSALIMKYESVQPTVVVGHGRPTL
ncbi:hypothetical protein Anapl_11124 [Anas platyrhynchos]|uniref:Uncharacterized protein n=1 Tax=Anas platyrhynchos TaxID=8839 RepID=R0K4M0_ANAPL|nr:hypothetical protein Anapl_11124 [Anas platyrhynchos]